MTRTHAGGHQNTYGTKAFWFSMVRPSFLALILLVHLSVALHAHAQQPSSGISAAGPSLASPSAKTESSAKKHKIGPLEVSGNWRVRAEGWNWFEANTGENGYAFMHSLLRVGLGQQSDRFDWKVEGAQDTILALPSAAAVPAPQGQLGLGGSYFAANGNHRNNANGFIKQAYVRFKKLRPLSVQLGRFEFFDGIEVLPKDPTLAALAQTRVAQRLIGNFGWSAVGRSFDGVHLSIDSGRNTFTFVGARPARGVFQADAMGELDIDLFYGSYIRPVTTKHSAGRLRVFAIGYLDHRNTILKTDNRPLAMRRSR